jgi:hypothetical protein
MTPGHAGILSWLDSVGTKRRRSIASPDVAAHLTPAPSRNDDGHDDDGDNTISQSPTKRRRGDPDGSPDEHAPPVETTPRPTTRTRPGRQTPSLASGQTASSTSGRTAPSPRKQLARMQLLEDGFDRAMFHELGLPPSLAKVVKALRAIKLGRGVVPTAHEVCCLPMACPLRRR